MLLPIGDINPREREPYVNYALLAANVGAYLLYGLQPGYDRIVLAHGVVPARPELLDYFTSMFLHADPMHLFGNMLFLWICGDNVEDRLGSLGYLIFYLACGLLASKVHVWSSLGGPGAFLPTIGASGAISGVLGAYVVFFPDSQIKVLYFFGLWGAGVAHVRSLWAIGFWFGEQLLFTLYGGGSNVAYMAHIGGFVGGAAAAFVLIGSGQVGRSPARGRAKPWRRGHEYDSWERW
ncbi:MAG: rhomboid family intramembrane serine protease [Planctomycetes bacterium]|nr:rhomboid family intramembrane serine protease [Planctomycetota bacterium]